MRSVALAAISLLLLATAVACGDDDDTPADEPAAAQNVDASAETDSSTDDASPDDASDSADAPAAADTDDIGADDAPVDEPATDRPAAATGDGGTLTLGDEVIQLERARCFLQEQDVAGSPGKILFTGQGFGTTAAGEDFVLDVSRYDQDSLFTGDDIHVDVGDPFGDDFYSWDGRAGLGTIERAGSTLRATGLTFRHTEDGTEVSGSFELSC